MAIINFDLKQIEIICFSQLCKDPTLLKILNEGRDIHKFMVSSLYGEKEEDISSDDPRRKDVKPGTFGIIYGNGAQKLSLNTGKDVEWCKNFIETFYKMFPMAKKWHNYIQAEVEAKGELKLFTGLRLKFDKKPAQFEWQIRKGILESYNPPDIKNWPVQSLAKTIAALWIGNFYREKAIYKKEKYILINTVHDSLMLDCNQEFVNEALNDCQEIVDKLPEYISKLWGIKWLAPIKIDVKIGDSWADV